MNAELFPEISVQALHFDGRPRYVDVVNALAALKPEQLTSLTLAFTRAQWRPLIAEMEALRGTSETDRRSLCGFPVVLSN